MTARSHTRQKNNHRRRQRAKVLKRAGVSDMESYYLYMERKYGADRYKARNKLRVKSYPGF